MFLQGDVVASAVGIHLLVTQEAPESHLPNATQELGFILCQCGGSYNIIVTLDVN